ncbi:hypothetical protein DFH06DRAFT_1440195 [Mycena polygramma]|nr:hypothetical protein DFH06DRAFT_1440195 [Mycena polygramma]
MQTLGPPNRRWGDRCAWVELQVNVDSAEKPGSYAGTACHPAGGKGTQLLQISDILVAISSRGGFAAQQAAHKQSISIFDARPKATLCMGLAHRKPSAETAAPQLYWYPAISYPACQNLFPLPPTASQYQPLPSRSPPLSQRRRESCDESRRTAQPSAENSETGHGVEDEDERVPRMSQYRRSTRNRSVPPFT